MFFFWSKTGDWASRQEKDKTERAIGVGRRTREKIVKWNQITALGFQTESRHQTSPASQRGKSEVISVIRVPGDGRFGS